MSSNTFGPDELSELGEALEDACQEAIRKGFPIRAAQKTLCSKLGCCPMGALLPGGPMFPSPRHVEAQLGIPKNIVWSFMVAFDGNIDSAGANDSPDAFALGRLFREKYVTGGGK